MPPEFSIRSDSVDVEQIMKQIRARIREKRGVDYTEEEIRELANVKLEKFLDPAKLRSDLLQHYRSRRPLPRATLLAPIEVPVAPANFAFEADTPYQSSRGAFGWLLYNLRRVLRPILKLFINPNPIVHVINMQSAINAQTTARLDRLIEQVQHLNSQLNDEWLQAENARRDLDALNYELAHNLVLEATRLGMDVKNMKMRVESIASRLDFAERRARALEGVVMYRPGTGPAAETTRPASGTPAGTAPPAPAAASGDPSLRDKGDAQRRRRRRRRGRGSSGQMSGPAAGPGAGEAADDVLDAGPDGDTTAGADDGGDQTPAATSGPEVPPADTPRDPDPSS